MKLHFPNRKEARAYCKSKGLPYTVISDTGRRKSAVRWVVDAPSPDLEVGKFYQLTDRNGFIKGNSAYHAASQVIQADEIRDKCKGVVKVVELYGSTGVTIQPAVGVDNLTFKTLGFSEAIYFKEVADPSVPVAPVAVKPKSKPAPQIKPVGVSPTVSAQQALEDELDGKEAPKPESDVWEVDHDYVLIDETAFIKETPENSGIVANIKNISNGVYSVQHVRKIAGGAELKQSFKNNYLAKCERKFFKDVTGQDKPEPLQTVAQLAATEIEELDNKILAKKAEFADAIKHCDSLEAELRELVKKRISRSQDLVDAVLSR